MMESAFITTQNNINHNQTNGFSPKKMSNTTKLRKLRDRISKQIASEFIESRGVLEPDEYSNIIIEFVKSTSDHAMDTEITPGDSTSNMVNGSLSYFIENVDNSLIMSSSDSNPKNQSFNCLPELELVFDDYIINFPSICARPPVAQSMISFHQKQLSSIVEESPWINHTLTIKNPRMINGFSSKYARSSTPKTITVTDVFFATPFIDPYLSQPRPQPYVNVPEAEIKPNEIRKPEKSRKRTRSSTAYEHHNNFNSIPLGSFSSQIEHIQYSEIQTPSFKLYQPGTISNRLEDGFIEDTSDKAYLDRHEHLEADEHTRYLNALQYGRNKNKRKDSMSSKSHGKSQKDGRNREYDSLTNITLYDEDLTALF